jgi:hypothetical protein
MVHRDHPLISQSHLMNDKLKEKNMVFLKKKSLLFLIGNKIQVFSHIFLLEKWFQWSDKFSFNDFENII